MTCGLALMVAACAQNPSPRAGVSTPDTSFDFVGWDSYLGGGDSSQFSSLDQINRANVTKLQVAWIYPAGTGTGGNRFNPLVVDGVMYVVAHDSAVVALDAATGKELWRRTNKGRVGARGMNFWKSADGRDRRLLFINDGMLRAISADTGEPIEAFGQAGKVDLRTGLQGDLTKIRPLQTDNPGRIFENLLIISLPAGAYDYASAPGDIHAYDVRTGALVWQFHVVPRLGEFGSETWPEKGRENFGGIHNWSESTIDKDLGIVYIPTGTARYDFYGGNRAGDNLFANSILALDARTGKRVWHYQTIHHDLWDYDLPTAPKLLTIHRDGKAIPALVQPSKQGFLFVFDRRDGKPIWPIEERPVPASDVPGEKASPTQPFPTLPLPFARQSFTEADINPHISEADKAKVREIFRTHRNEGLFTPPTIRGTIQMPGHNGGTNYGLSSVDPLRQRFYVAAKSLPTIIKLTADKREQALAAMPNGGGDVIPYRAPVDFMMQSNSLSAVGPPWSTITAYDMNEGRILWQVPDGEVTMLEQKGITGVGSHAPRGGLVTTAGGLMFVGTSSDRKFRARDVDSGKVLWEIDLPAASEGVPAIYEVGGRQFVVIPVGGNGAFSDGFGMPKPGPNQFMAFALPAGTKTGGKR
ncbi:MAG: pyrroloquinoline quinone-dependent dehydrogenase [Sphingomonas bacterium]|nr:pyrroloquinoline quinone-dependent dehydrogenase [Sphingomonas bacterium]